MAFLFIFMGISAFTTGGSFESVINSLLTVGAGLAATSGGDKEAEKKSDKGLEETLEESEKRGSAAE